jgi:hypothetical protein
MAIKVTSTCNAAYAPANFYKKPRKHPLEVMMLKDAFKSMCMHACMHACTHAMCSPEVSRDDSLWYVIVEWAAHRL